MEGGELNPPLSLFLETGLKAGFMAMGFSIFFLLLSRLDVLAVSEKDYEGEEQFFDML